MEARLFVAVFFLTSCLTGSSYAECLQPHCPPHSNFTECVLDSQRSWGCNGHQFCEVRAEGHNVRLTCKENPERERCMEEHRENHHQCNQFLHHTGPPCMHCCEERDCLLNLIGVTTPTTTTTAPVTTTSAHTTSTTRALPTTVASTVAMTKTNSTEVRNCYDPVCRPEHDLATCTLRSLVCTENEFCMVDSHKNGQIHMHCADKDKELQNCLRRRSHNHPECNNFTLPSSRYCKFCCDNTDCVRSSIGTHAVWECKDHYKGNCSQDFPGMCSDPIIRNVCQSTCGMCDSTSSAPTVAGTTHSQQSTTAAATAGTTVAGTTHSQQSTTVAATAGTTVAGTTHSQESTTTAAAAAGTTGAINTTANPVTTTPPKKLQCIQCGNYSNMTPCTVFDMLEDVTSDCDDVTASFCMTDIIVDTAGTMSMYKRCVNKETCVNRWYLETSDKPACLNYDPYLATSDLECHFCCTGNSCNTATVPDRDVQWRP